MEICVVDLLINYNYLREKKREQYALFFSPEDGFEPPLEEPESPVLPLDDSGILFIILHLKKIKTRKV